ncbi:MAG: EAL domain-containing protein [Pseudomonadota bacterium]
MTLAPSNPVPFPIKGQFDDGTDAFELAHRLEVAVWVYDIDHSRVIFANQSACELWQAKDEAELRERDMGRDMSSTVAKRLRQYQNDFIENDSTFTELWTLYPNGLPKSVMVIFRGFALPDGRMAMLCEAKTEAQDQPQNLRSTEALLHTDVIITLYAKDGPPLYQNPAARNTAAAMDTDLQSTFVDIEKYTQVMRKLEDVGEDRIIARVHTADGPRWHDLSAKLCSDAVTGQPAVLVTAIDVSELKEARDTARRLANRDQLTNLFNRAYLQTHLSNLADKHDTGQCALIFFDIDRFKQINDRLGHDAGDSVLRQIALRTRSLLRSNDLVARLGGDEFVVLMENVTCGQEVKVRTARLCQSITLPVMYGKTKVDVGVSVGIALFHPKETDFDVVLREADIALYVSKQSGRNRATVFTKEMGEEAKARDDIEVELKAAIGRNEFVLHYQPRLDIKTGKIVAVEGLVRWNHPNRGLLFPDSFISICEETGIIEDLGREVLEIGVDQAIAWQRAGLDLSMSLNASPRQFHDNDFLRSLKELSARPDFPAGKIELEITESVLAGDPTVIAEKLRRIAAMGYRIAIDDFGTGYSNLSYILQFPLTCLKIDRSFINQLPESGPIIRLIITLGQQIGAKVVTEGVETTEQLDWLAQNLCDEAQGYLITRPLPPEDFMAFLDNSNQGA